MSKPRLHRAVNVGGASQTNARTQDTTQTTTGQKRAVSARAVLIGLVCAAFLCAVTPYNDFKIAATYLAGTQFPIGAIFVLLLFAAPVNMLLRKIAPRLAFSQGELLTIWALILVASGLPSSGMMRYLIPLIVAPHGLSTPANDWENKVWGAVPDWLKITDPAAATAFYTGYPRGQERIPWEAWATPLFFWGILAVLFLIASFCVANLLRKQWVENEKFVFPLVTLPVLLAEEPDEKGHLVNRLLRNPLMWLAVVFVSVIHTMNGMHLLYPSVPGVTTQWNFNEFLTTPPLNGVGWMPFNLYPLVIGISFLMSTEVCFSLWFFFLFFKLQMLIMTMYNFDKPGVSVGYGTTLFHGLEAFGGSIALLIWTLWAARKHLRDFWEKATGGANAHLVDDSREMLSYRATLIGLIVSYGGMAAWLYFAGVPGFLIGLSLLIMTLAFLTISWMVCQSGTLMAQVPLGSIDVVASTMGTAAFKIAPMHTITRFEGAFFYDTRELMTASLLNSAKTADAAQFPVRPLFRALAVSVAICFAVSLVAALALPYYNGGANTLSDNWGYKSFPQKSLGFLAGASSLAQPGSFGYLVHILSGLGGVLLLLIARAQFNFGLHPIGFLAASTYPMHMLWGSFLVGWLFKSLILRYSGMRGYRNLLPFFLGLILGDVINASLWILISYATGTGYRIMPG